VDPAHTRPLRTPGEYTLAYDERPLAEALPASPPPPSRSIFAAQPAQKTKVPRCLGLRGVSPQELLEGGPPAVVACHACAHLSLQLAEMASVARSPAIVLMPCCHSAKVG
jgi:hypothetical protein